MSELADRLKGIEGAACAEADRAGEILEGLDRLFPDDALGWIDAIADRHDIAAERRPALEGLVRLLDWDRNNHLPETAPELPEPATEISWTMRRVAKRMLGESLAALELEPVRDARRAVDIGSGAGFPGLVLGIGLPETRVSLLERDAHSAGFLRAASEELGLENVDVVQQTVQNWSEADGTCDLVTSRKMWRMDLILGSAARLLAPGGFVVLWERSRDAEAEAEAEAAAEACGLRLLDVHEARGGRRAGKRHLYLYGN